MNALAVVVLTTILLELFLAALADRSARAEAWRQIAQERRVNAEQLADLRETARELRRGGKEGAEPAMSAEFNRDPPLGMARDQQTRHVR